MADLTQFYGLTLWTDISADEIQASLHATEFRVATPDSFLTMDYIESRITIYVDSDNIIQEIVWG